MMVRLRSFLDAAAVAALPAFVLVPPVAALLAILEIRSQDWFAQGLGALALSHALHFVGRASLVAWVLLLGLRAAAVLTRPSGMRLVDRVGAAIGAWCLLLYPAQQLMLPAFRIWMMRNEKGNELVLALLAVPQSVLATSAVGGLVAWAVWRLRGASPGMGVHFDPRPHYWSLVPGVLLALAGWLGGAALPNPPKGAPNVVFLLVDTLRADRLGTYGYKARATSPHLDAFAQDSVTFVDAVSPAPWTSPSVAAMLTSRYPRRLGFRQVPVFLAPREVSVAEVFQANGYRTHAVVSNIFASSAIGFDAGFDSMDESQIAGHLDISSGAVTDRAIDWIDRHREEPFFLYVHYFDPHFAYLMHEEDDFGGSYAGAFREPMTHVEFMARLTEMSPADLEYVRAAYDSEVAYTDSQIGRLLDHLKSRGLYDNTMVVFTADHGEALDDRGDHFIGHGATVLEEQLHVPLLVKKPGQGDGGRRVTTRVSTMDIAPTMLAAAGARFPAVSGIDGTLLEPPAPDRLLFGETRRDADKRAVYRGAWKLVVDRESGSTRLFDLDRDPGERRDVAPSQPEVAAGLTEALTDWEASLGEREAGAAPFSEAQKQQLRALGYAE